MIQSYTLTLDFVKKKFMDIWKTYLSTKSSNLWWPKQICENNLHILEDSASGVQVGDIEQVHV